MEQKHGLSFWKTLTSNFFCCLSMTQLTNNLTLATNIVDYHTQSTLIGYSHSHVVILPNNATLDN